MMYGEFLKSSISVRGSFFGIGMFDNLIGISTISGYVVVLNPGSCALNHGKYCNQELVRKSGENLASDAELDAQKSAWLH